MLRFPVHAGVSGSVKVSSRPQLAVQHSPVTESYLVDWHLGYPENMPVLRLQQPCFLSISRVGDELRISPWVLRELGAAISI
jgi:hypothetical protein